MYIFFFPLDGVSMETERTIAPCLPGIPAYPGAPFSPLRPWSPRLPSWNTHTHTFSYIYTHTCSSGQKRGHRLAEQIMTYPASSGIQRICGAITKSQNRLETQQLLTKLLGFTCNTSSDDFLLFNSSLLAVQ